MGNAGPTVGRTAGRAGWEARNLAMTATAGCREVAARVPQVADSTASTGNWRATTTSVPNPTTTSVFKGSSRNSSTTGPPEPLSSREPCLPAGIVMASPWVVLGGARWTNEPHRVGRLAGPARRLVSPRTSHQQSPCGLRLNYILVHTGTSAHKLHGCPAGFAQAILGRSAPG